MKNQKKLISAMEAIRKQDPLLAEAIEKAWKSLTESEEDFDVDEETYLPDVTQTVECKNPSCHGLADVKVDPMSGDEYAECNDCGEKMSMAEVDRINARNEAKKINRVNRSRINSRNKGTSRIWTDEQKRNVFGDNPFDDDALSSAI